MKIINFNKFQPFIEIRNNMRISKDYKPNFRGSKAIIRAITWEEIKTRGLDISIDELIKANDGTIEHKDFPGQKMIVYIRDFRSDYGLPKFHVSWCSTLEKMKEAGRYSRYVISQRNDGIFLLNRTDGKKVEEENIEAKLDICKNCLTTLNYENYSVLNYQQKQKIVDKFTVKNFLKKFNTDIRLDPEYSSISQPKNVYPENWQEISIRYRKMKNWICEDCGLDFSSNPSKLHVHHIDGNKFNCKPSNLESTCEGCHKNKPYHEHMK